MAFLSGQEDEGIYMTLYASIEKMKEHLESVAICINNEAVHDAIDKALAAAPAQARTEDEIADIIDNDVKGQIAAFGKWNPQSIVSALKEAGCLYCKEGK